MNRCGCTIVIPDIHSLLRGLRLLSSIVAAYVSVLNNDETSMYARAAHQREFKVYCVFPANLSCETKM